MQRLRCVGVLYNMYIYDIYCIHTGLTSHSKSSQHTSFFSRFYICCYLSFKIFLNNILQYWLSVCWFPSVDCIEVKFGNFSQYNLNLTLFFTTFGLLGCISNFSFFPNLTSFFNLCGSYLCSSAWKFLTFLGGRDLRYLLFIVSHFYFFIILICRIHVTTFLLTSECVVYKKKFSAQFFLVFGLWFWWIKLVLLFLDLALFFCGGFWRRMCIFSSVNVFYCLVSSLSKLAENCYIVSYWIMGERTRAVWQRLVSQGEKESRA